MYTKKGWEGMSLQEIVLLFKEEGEEVRQELIEHVAKNYKQELGHLSAEVYLRRAIKDDIVKAL